MYQGLEVLTDALCIVGESPIWLEKEKKIAYVDIRGKSVRWFDPADGKMEDVVYPQKIAFITENASGDLMAGAVDGIYRIDKSGKFELFSKPFAMKGERFNDGKIARNGEMYMGTFSMDYTAAFYRMGTDGVVHELFDGVGNSNGLDWDEARNILYYNDTYTDKVDAFDFDAESGAIGNRRVAFRYKNPDGMCIDSDGNLWTALWGSSMVVCVDPREGKLLREIPVPVKQPSCCSFWGENLENLVITTAAAGCSIREAPLSGALFTIRTGAHGVPRHKMNV